jgi:amidase
LRADALRGRRLGLYGPGWRDQSLSEETTQLYRRSATELERLGAVLIEDPFRDSGFAQLRRTSALGSDYDERGGESLPYDLQLYLEHLGPRAALRSFKAFAAATSSDDPFRPEGVLRDAASLPGFAHCRAEPLRAPDQSEFVALREEYLAIFRRVCEQARLDAVVFPQMREELPGIFAGVPIRETTVSEINIAGLPGINVPAGYYASGAPFSLIFVGDLWREAQLLAYAFAYECATQHRRPPLLSP